MDQLSLADIRRKYPQASKLSDEDLIEVVAKQYGASVDEMKSVLGYEAPAPRSRTWGDVASDALVTATKSAVGLPQAFVGLIDIPTGGRVGKALEEVGYRPNETQNMLSDMYSDPQKAANKQVNDAQGFTDTALAYIKNPSTIATTVGESAGQMLGGAGAARKLISLFPKLAPWAAGAIGEGLMGAGSAEEQLRAESPDGLTTAKQGAAALASGAGTALFGAAGGKIANSKLGQKLGIADIDTMLASGATMPKTVGFLKAAATSGISEGALEEMPQSAWEQMMQNYAQDKPILEGVDKAMASGFIAGAAMGGGAGGFNSLMAKEAPLPKIEPPKSIMDQTDIDSVISAAESSVTQAPVVQKAATPIDDPMRLEVINQLPEQFRDAAIRAYNIITDEEAPKGIKKQNQKLLDDILEQASSMMQPQIEDAPKLDQPTQVAPIADTAPAVGNSSIDQELEKYISEEQAKENTRVLSDIENTDSRVAFAQEQAIATKRNEIIDQILSSDAAVGMRPAKLADMVKASMASQGYANPILNDSEFARIKRFTDIAKAEPVVDTTSQDNLEGQAPSSSLSELVPEKKVNASQSDAKIATTLPDNLIDVATQAKTPTEFFKALNGLKIPLGQRPPLMAAFKEYKKAEAANAIESTTIPESTPVQESAVINTPIPESQSVDQPSSIVNDASKQELQNSVSSITPTAIPATAIPETTLKDNGALSIKGDTKVLQTQLKEAGIPSLPSKDGVTVGAKNAEKAQEFVASLNTSTIAQGNQNNLITVDSATVGPTSKTYQSAIVTPAVDAITSGKSTKVELKDGTTVDLVNMVDSDGARTIVAVSDGNVVGSIGYATTEGVNPDVYVEKDFQRKGIATAMYNLAEQTGGVIPPVDTVGAIRTEDGTAFRNARAGITTSIDSGVKLTNPAQETAAKKGMELPYKKGKTGAETARNRLAYENPFLSFLATHGVSILDRSDVGGEKGRPKLIAGHGPLFRKNGLRLDELAQLAAEKGFLTKAQIESENDNGGVNALSDMINSVMRNEVVTTVKDVAANRQADEQLQEEAYSLGIDITGKTGDEVYDLVQEYHREKGYQEAVDLLNELNQEHKDASQEYNLQELVLDIEEFENAEKDSARGQGATSEVAGEIDTRGTGKTESSSGSTVETPTKPAQESDAGGGDQGFRLTGETEQEASARLAKEDSDAKAKESETAKQDEADRKARIKKEIDSRQASSAENFQLGQSAEDSLSGQADIFSSPTAEAAKEQIHESDLTPAEKLANIAAVNRGDVSPDDIAKVFGTGQSVESKQNKISDFGEKIGGARKDIWAGFKDKLNDAMSLSMEDAPLSKSWPEPDYQKLIESGADSFVVGFIRAARDELPSKPKKSYKLRGWVSQAETLRSLSKSLLEGDAAGRPELLNKLLSEKQFARISESIGSRAELYQAVGHEKSLAGIVIARGEYMMLNGIEYRPPKILWTVEKKAAATAFSTFPQQLGVGDTRAQAIEDFKNKYDAMVVAKPASKEVSFDVFSERGKPGFFIGKKVGRNYLTLEGPFDTVKEARSYKSENQDKLVAKLEKSKEIPSERKDTNDPRVGEDMRNGQDVTPEMFTNAFGFRGVEFGNYVEQTKRQEDLNNAYDALMDMAALLQIPPKAISLNGELGLAFGARGKGLKLAGGVNAAAHYEHGHVVINLTKKSGAGSLGHEWWHALDNYFSRMANKKNDYMTDRLDVSLASRGSNYVYRDEGVRKEMIDAFGAVMKAIRSTAIKARSSKLDGKRTKEYWTTDVEMSARAFESYLISKLQDNNASNDYLANIVSQETWEVASKIGFELDESYPYPTAGEVPAIRAGFDHFFSVIESKQTEKGIALYSKKRSQNNSQEVRGQISEEVGSKFRELVKKNGDAFQFDKLTGDKDLGKTLRQIGIPTGVSALTKENDNWRDGQDQQWQIKSASGDVAYVYRKSNEVQINVLNLKSTKSKGTEIYQAVESWAFANNYKFIGDSQGITRAGQIRRTENMISSILRHDSIDHVKPHDDSKLPVDQGGLDIQWFAGNRDRSLGELLVASYKNIERVIPEIKYVHATKFGDFEYRGSPEHTDGDLFTADDIKKLADEYETRELSRAGGDPSKASRVGNNTLTRAIYTGTLYRSAVATHGAELHDRVEYDRVDGTNEGIGPEGLTKTLYSRSGEASGKTVSDFAPLAKKYNDKISKNGFELVVVQSETDLPDNADAINSSSNEKIEGAYLSGNTAYIVADSISDNKRFDEVAQHELSHLATEKLLSSDEWARGLRSIQTLERMNNKTLTKLGEIVNKEQPGLDAETRAREIAALLVETGEYKNVSVLGKLVSSLTMKLKAMLRAMGLNNNWVNSLNEGEVSALLRSAMGRLYGDAEIKNSGSSGNTLFSKSGNDKPLNAANPHSWNAPEPSSFDDLLYKFQDKQIDTKRVIDSIDKNIADDLNVYQKEELFHNRAASRVKEFINKEQRPLLNSMKELGIDMPTLEEYLHARTAEESNDLAKWRNPTKAELDKRRDSAKSKIDNLKSNLAVKEYLGLKQDLKIAQLQDEINAKSSNQAQLKLVGQKTSSIKTKIAALQKANKEISLYVAAEQVLSSINKITPFTGDNTWLSGMKTADARKYLASLSPVQRKNLEIVASKVDAILEGTRQMYVDYGLESKDTVDGWRDMFDHYVPLMREQEGETHGMGVGQGFSVKGKEVKGRTGSTRKVVDIFANIAMQREKVIVRGEKNKVAKALLDLATATPNPDFWSVDKPETKRVYDPDTDSVKEQSDPLFKSRENVIVAKVQGAKGKIEEKAIIFNETNARAMRMVTALKNLDTANMNGFMGGMAKITRYFSAINTQYNPIFGVVNLTRDLQGAMVNLTSTPLKDQKAQVAKHTLSALKAIYLDERAGKKGNQIDSEMAALWREFELEGGPTGYREMFANSADRAEAIESELNPTKWMDSPLGKVFTANGMLKVPLAQAQKQAKGLFGVLEDYNNAMENSVRLAAYKVAKDQGLSKEKAASLAKNLTVNFNRKGQVAQQVGALYAFFNASMQGTARHAKTLFTIENGDITTTRLSSTGKKIVYGGVLIGVVQALLLAAAGFDDDEPPQFVRERSLIIPTGWTGLTPAKGYINIPMPLGLHILPNIGRISSEFALGGFKRPADKVFKLMGLTVDAFNPTGGGASFAQAISFTVTDPIIALAENKDWTGKPIAKESHNKALPGHLLVKDTATYPAKIISEALNYLSGGTQYTAGAFSPTPDQIDYLAGQATGGVGREVSKTMQTLSALYTGEDLPINKVPLVGRFYGSAETQSAQANRFYSNLDRLNEHETEIKGMMKDRKGLEVARYLRDNPEARMYEAANQVERAVQQLRQRKRELIKSKAEPSKIKAIDEQIKLNMARFNESLASISKRSN